MPGGELDDEEPDVEASAGDSAGPAADVADVLRFLRGLANPCEPPIGVGSFDVLYANEREVVVWYSPAREGHEPGEVAIPTAMLAAAWAALAAGSILDDLTLTSIGAGPARGRWLLALLAQTPGVRVQQEPLALLLDSGEPNPPAPFPLRREGGAGA